MLIWATDYLDLSVFTYKIWILLHGRYVELSADWINLFMKIIFA